VLHRAAEQGQLGMVEALLDAGAHPNPEASGHTPRSLAPAHDHAEIVAAWTGASASAYSLSLRTSQKVSRAARARCRLMPKCAMMPLPMPVGARSTPSSRCSVPMG